jgi:hypothetical protein
MPATTSNTTSGIRDAENLLGDAPLSLKLHLLGMMEYMFPSQGSEPKSQFAAAIGRRIRIVKVSWSDKSSLKKSVSCEVVCELTVAEGKNFLTAHHAMTHSRERQTW